MLLVVTLMLGSVACTGTWERHPTIEHKLSSGLLAASDIAIVCDTFQTLSMSDGGKWNHGLHEGNPLLGEHPSTTVIVGAGVVALVGNTALFYVLPPRLRPWWFGAVATAETVNVIHFAQRFGVGEAAMPRTR
jgi:hypothetical protein